MRNFKIIGGILYVVGNGLASFTFHKIEVPTNVAIIGYSEALKELYVMYVDFTRYIYKDVPKVIWDNWFTYEGTFGEYQAQSIKGYFRFIQVPDMVVASSMEELLKEQVELLHHYDTTCGLWAVDQNPSDVTYDWLVKNAFQITANKTNDTV